jgi:hypothetical protein
MVIVFVPCAVRNEYLTIAQSCYRCSALTCLCLGISFVLLHGLLDTVNRNWP